MLLGKRSQRRTIDAGDNLLHSVGNAVFITRGNDIRAIECAPVANLLGGGIDALVHHRNVAGSIKTQVAEMYHGPTMADVNCGVSSVGRRYRNKRGGGDGPEHDPEF